MNRKAGLFILVICLTMSLLLQACGKSGNSNASEQPSPSASASASGSAAPASEEAPKPLQFSFFANYDWYVQPGPWGEDPISKWIKEKKQVEIEFIPTGGQAAQKLNSLIASDKLPDVIWGDKGNDVERLRAAGKLVPLDAYLDKYPNLKAQAGEKTLNMLRSSDGKLYQFPNWYTMKPAASNAGYVINMKVYKALGSPKLETMDDLYSYLKLVHEKYPDMTPFSIDGGSGSEIVYSGFGEEKLSVYPSSKFYPEGNQLKPIMEDPIYVQSMTYLSKLFREKLINQDALTEKSDQIKEKLANGKIAVYATYNATSVVLADKEKWKESDPEADYEVIWPLHAEGIDKNKVFINGYSTLGWNVAVITTAAKDPEAVFAFLDWMTGKEGQSLTAFGPQGLYWDETDADGAPIPNDKWTSTSDSDKAKTHMYDWDLVGYSDFVDNTKTKIEMALPEDKRNKTVTAQVNVTWKTAKDTTEFNNLNTDPNSAEGIAEQRVNDLLAKVFAKVMFAKSDDEVKSLLEQADKDSKDLGNDKVLAFKTKTWQDNLTKMNGGQ